MLICPKCRDSFADDVRSCPKDKRRPLPQAVLEASGNDPLLGTSLAERYTIIGRLGAGGMGTVYRAEQSPLEREVALKVLRKELGRDPETVGRFTREAKLLSQLRHPNTVAILDFGQSREGLLYLAMELLEGEMLSARLRSDGPLDVEVALRVASGVLRSLDEAHARGIIHRDLKPDNIFLARVHGRPDDDEVVKVVDFGIAKIRDGDAFPGLDPVATQEGTVFGTPRYMSPEQAQGRSLDGRSDLYAVGVLLFHMLTGSAPFTDDDAVIVMAHHIKTVPPPVRRLVPDRGIPASLEQLVERALSKNPDDRPQTAEEFLTELEALRADIPAARAAAALHTANTVILQVAPSSPRRTWIGAATAAATLVVMLVGLSVAARRHSVRARALSANAATQQVVRSEAPSAARAAPPAESPAADTPLEDAATSADPTLAATDGEARLRREPRRPGLRGPLAPPTVAAPVAPAAPVSVPRRGRPAQPYQTFEGM